MRAVVVAGWAVDDAAGRDFAIQFYRQMLVEKGQFGEAVRYARRYIYENHDQVNSWGAFQCYGLPSFVLGGQPQQSSGRQKPPVTQSEIIERLRRIQVDAQSAGASTPERVDRQVARV